MFRCLDPSPDGYLDVKKMLEFARLMEYPGDEEDWSQEFQAMSELYGFDAKKGVDEACFFKILDDAEGDMAVEDEQLPDMLKDLKARKPSKPAVSSDGPATSSELPKAGAAGVKPQPALEKPSGRAAQM